MTVVRWFARILSILIIAFHAMSFLADRPQGMLTTRDMINLSLWGLIMLGLLLAWKWERVGGLIVIGAFVVQVAMNPVVVTMWPFWVAPAVGLLFVLCSMSRPKGNGANAHTP